MAETQNLSKAKQVRNLLLIIGSAIGVSFFVMFLMIYSSGQANGYLAKNVLLSPENAKILYFNDFNSKARTNSHFVFDLIEFSYYDATQRTIKHAEISVTSYAKLYELLENDISLLDASVESEVASKFNHASRLLFKVRADDDASKENSKNLFEVDFIKDYYRISLRGQNADMQWAYFKHADIMEQVLILFVSR